VTITEPVERLRAAVPRMTPGQLRTFAASCDPDELALLEQVVADVTGAGWRHDPAAMAAYLTPDRADGTPGYRLLPYVRHLGEKFRQLVTGESTRQIWNLPGRLGKSLLGSQWGPVWALDYSEGLAKLILVSYGQLLADENARAVRDLLRLHSDKLRCQLQRDSQKKDRFHTGQGGGLLAAGLDSTITGFGAGAGGGIICDDLFKSWAEAHSETQRQKVYDQYRGTIRNRLDEESAFILHIGHRLHIDDLHGRLLLDQLERDGEEWDVTALPHIAVEGDPLGREPGETLDPERFPTEAAATRARAIGSYLAAALEGQAPIPEEGNELQRSWFVLDETLPTKPDACLTSWDLKLKDNERGDYVVGQVWWRVAGGYWCMDQLRGQFDHATTANAIALLQVRHPYVKQHLVEFAGSADTVMPKLREKRPRYQVTDEMASRLGMNADERAAVQALRRRGMSGLLPRTPKGDKAVRARAAITPLAEAGDVHLPAAAAWVPRWLDEMAAFPNGAHDDQVDAASQALAKLHHARASAKAPTGRQVPEGPKSVGRAPQRAGTRRVPPSQQRRLPQRRRPA
jgi:predicted phage terminase large subunit-like protein